MTEAIEIYEKSTYQGKRSPDNTSPWDVSSAHLYPAFRIPAKTFFEFCAGFKLRKTLNSEAKNPYVLTLFDRIVRQQPRFRQFTGKNTDVNGLMLALRDGAPQKSAHKIVPIWQGKDGHVSVVYVCAMDAMDKGRFREDILVVCTRLGGIPMLEYLIAKTGYYAKLERFEKAGAETLPSDPIVYKSRFGRARRLLNFARTTIRSSKGFGRYAGFLFCSLFADHLMMYPAFPRDIMPGFDHPGLVPKPLVTSTEYTTLDDCMLHALYRRVQFYWKCDMEPRCKKYKGKDIHCLIDMTQTPRGSKDFWPPGEPAYKRVGWMHNAINPLVRAIAEFCTEAPNTEDKLRAPVYMNHYYNTSALRHRTEDAEYSHPRLAYDMPIGLPDQAAVDEHNVKRWEKMEQKGWKKRKIGV